MTRVLVAIASYGRKNDRFLHRLLDEYRSMAFDVDVVVLSEADKPVPGDVELRVGLPAADPWSLPFAHRELFAERSDDYDLFVYSEDDTLVRQHNLEAFLEVNELLPESMVPGFMRYEVDAEGRRSFSTIHSHFHWDPTSVETCGGETFAWFTNEHSAGYVLTRPQLKQAIASGGFLVAPHAGYYDMLVSAATDPYTRCGLARRVCVSRIEDFLLRHLPDAYLGRLGIDEPAFAAQVRAVQAVADGTLTRDRLVDPSPRLDRADWQRSFFHALDPQVKALVPTGVGSALSVGTCSGVPERDALGDACRIVGIPQDHIIAAAARLRGIQTLEPDLDRSLADLERETFDCVLALDVIHRVSDPVEVLEKLRRHLRPGGTLLVTVPNVTGRRLRARMQGRPLPRPMSFAARDVHPTTPAMLRAWIERAGYERPWLDHVYAGRAAPFARRAPRVAGTLVGVTLVARGSTR